MTEAPETPGADAPVNDVEFSRVYALDYERVSAESQDIARKIEALVLRNVRSQTGTHVARTLGMSDSSLSRLLSQGMLSAFSVLLATLGLKVVPADAIVYVKPEEFN